MTVAADPSNLAVLRGELRDWLALAGIDTEDSADALPAIGEAASNAAEHSVVGTVLSQDSTQIADMLAVLQSRGAIEQAKGAIMGSLRCDAETAWTTLRRASRESNVKLRVLAVALVEFIGGGPAEQPAVAAPIVPDDAAARGRSRSARLSHISRCSRARGRYRHLIRRNAAVATPDSRWRVIG